MPNRKKKSPSRSSKPTSPWRRAARWTAVGAILVFLALAVGGNIYVHHSPDWLADHRSPLTAPLEYVGNRSAFLTDALGWTGHDCVYETDDPIPEGQILFAGAPLRRAAPAPADLVTLDRGDFLIGWSPSLRHPVWAAYHVPRDARFDYNGRSRPSFKKDRSVETSPSPSDYEHTSYDRGHMVPNRATITRFGPDVQQKSFLMTNVAPQRPGLNRGPWREMEQRIADLWSQKYGEIWVIVGTIPAATRSKLGTSTIDVPEKFYMVAVAQTAEGVRSLAVLLDQRANRWDFPVHNIITIAELERLSGLEFFPDMPKFLKSPLKRDRPTRLWPIRFRDLVKLILIRLT